MCGIVGGVSREGTSIWTDLLDSLIHRGPDANGSYLSGDGKVWLGHTRLSILDLSDNAAQPMHSADGQYVLTFNGEIYNFQLLKKQLEDLGYKFISTSDTEVLIHGWSAWGVDLLQKLKGMFAFAVYDTFSNVLTIARDIAGEKPLYYTYNDSSFSFASEFHALPRRNYSLSSAGINYFLGVGYTYSDQTLLEGVHKLPAGCYLQYDCAQHMFSTTKFWQLPIFNTQAQHHDDYYLDHLDDLLTHAVASQLVADVPVGILLSGGLDSSLITALACKKTSGLHTYTVTFSGYEGGNESVYAQNIAKHFGTVHHEIEAGAVTPDLLLSLVKRLDHPIADPAFLPTYLLSKAIKKHCTVALGGDGADEVFGGYTRYLQWMELEKIGRWLPQSFRELIQFGSKSILPEGFRGRHFLEQLGTDFSKAVPIEDTLFDFEGRKRLLVETLACDISNLKMAHIDRDANFLDRSLRYDFTTFMCANILVKVDRASMLASLEVRAPFLDRDVVEFAFSSIPQHLKINGKQRKVILKKLARRYLPESFDFDRKQGFVPPLENWFKQPEWISFIEKELIEHHHPLFDPKEIKAIWKGQQQGLFNKRRIFTLLVLSIWLKHNQIGLN